MECYVGLDASLKKTSICVVDGTGKVLCEGVVDSQPGAIARFLKSSLAHHRTESGWASDDLY